MPDREPRPARRPTRASAPPPEPDDGPRRTPAEDRGTAEDRTERRSAERPARRRTAGDADRPAPARRRDGHGRVDARHAAARAAVDVQELTGRSPEGITSLERTPDGWQVGVEVLETRRVPDSTDILAVYQVVLDTEGELVSYRRDRRYHRGRASEELS